MMPSGKVKLKPEIGIEVMFAVEIFTLYRPPVLEEWRSKRKEEKNKEMNECQHGTKKRKVQEKKKKPGGISYPKLPTTRAP
jgi:hypothetical protein